jgi:glycine reductase
MEGYFPRGIRHEVFLEDIGQEPVMAADRVVDMMIAKLKGEPYQTELPMPALDRVPVAPAVKDLRKVRLALVTSGGIVPRENPDRIQSCSATKWGKYDISSLDKGFTAPEYKTIHAGYDPEQADKNPNVVVPLDAIRAYQREGRLGVVDEFFYTTVGTGTTQGEAARMGREIAAVLHERNVEAVVLTAT